MLDYKIVDAKDKDIDILISIKSVTMIDNEMDKVLSPVEKNKIKKNIQKNIELNYEKYKIIYFKNEIIGAYVVLPYENGYMIDELYIFENYRNKKVGNSIVESLKQQYTLLYVWVYKNNFRAINFFKKLGFIIQSEGRTLILKCDNVYELLMDEMSKIKIGYKSKTGKIHSSFKNDFKANFYLQSPKQLLQSKVGTCFEQVELERELLSKLGIDSRTYLLYYPDNEMDIAHSFIIYKDTQNYYWFEHSWIKYRGLHVYNTKQELLEDVLKKFIETIPTGSLDSLRLYLYNRPKYGISYSKFFIHCINS